MAVKCQNITGKYNVHPSPRSNGHPNREALETLIERITSPPIIGYPDYASPFVVHTDDLLYQKQDGILRVFVVCVHNSTSQL